MKTKIGIIGCGAISDHYYRGLSAFRFVELAAVADMNLERARAKGEEWKVRALSVNDLLAQDGIDIILNLTIPAAHAEVDLQILQAGKHPYSEKPLGLNREEGQKVLSLAKERDLRVGCAPDTVLGAGVQTSRKLIDGGWIGEPLAATAFMMSRGVERWHMNPNFYYEPGGGPLFDMGPYYLSALVNLLGPVDRVAGCARISRKERIIRNPNLPERWGEKIPVQVPTHVSASLEFLRGPIATLVTSFDVQASVLPRIEIYGTEGTLSVPDPNGFGGPVRLKNNNHDEWLEIPLSCSSVEPGRGLGPAEMALAIAENRPHRANGQIAAHVLDVMQSIHESAETGRHLSIHTTCEQPTLLEENLLER
jgi:predicted dehydrogenase